MGQMAACTPEAVLAGSRPYRNGGDVAEPVEIVTRVVHILRKGAITLVVMAAGPHGHNAFGMRIPSAKHGS